MVHSHMQGGHSCGNTYICNVNHIAKSDYKVDIQDGTHPEGHKQSDFMVNMPALNSEFPHISLIDHYRQLDNKPLINGSLIHSSPSVNSNTCFDGFYDTSVSNACLPIDNMNVLTYCTSCHNELTHKHCCIYSQGVFHQIDVVRTTGVFDTVDCLFVYPVSGDDISGFHSLDRNSSNLVGISNAPADMLQVIKGRECTWVRGAMRGHNLIQTC